MVLAHAFLALLESRRSLSVEPRRWFSINSKSTLIKADGVEIYGLTVRRPRKPPCGCKDTNGVFRPISSGEDLERGLDP